MSLQYAQSHMAVRYMVETYGARSAIDVVGKLAGASDLDEAIRQAIGVTYTAFEEGFVQYLRAWQDPSREAILRYTTVLQGALEGERQIRERRNKALSLPATQRLAAYEMLAIDARDVVIELQRADPPAAMHRLHDDAVAYLGRLADWLDLQLDYARTEEDSKRVEANGMIPEIGARSAGVYRGLSSAIFNYRLQGGAP